MINREQFDGIFHIVELIDNRFHGHLAGRATNDWKRYCRFEILENEEDSIIFWLDDDYRDYDHFVGVFSKFDPYVFFPKEPQQAELTFKALSKLKPTFITKAHFDT